MTTFSKSYFKNSCISLFLSVAVLFCAGCSKKEEPESISDLCKEDCESFAGSCPDGTAVKEAEELCQLFCTVYKDTEECRDKWNERSVCHANYAVDCDTGAIDDGGACDASEDPFVVDFSEESTSGECVREDVNTN